MFNNAICIYPTNNRVVTYNKVYLKQLDIAIVIANVVNTSTSAESVESCNTSNLYNTLLLYIKNPLIKPITSLGLTI